MAKVGPFAMGLRSAPQQMTESQLMAADREAAATVPSLLYQSVFTNNVSLRGSRHTVGMLTTAYRTHEGVRTIPSARN